MFGFADSPVLAKSRDKMICTSYMLSCDGYIYCKMIEFQTISSILFCAWNGGSKLLRKRSALLICSTLDFDLSQTKLDGYRAEGN
jgi:hypothetical protein